MIRLPSQFTPAQRRLLLALYLSIAAIVRSVDAWRPIDGSVWELWREADVGAIARNFYREDMDILHPRIDWRGDGPGLVESEFPLYPWTVAVVYHVFGYHEQIARLVSFVVSLLACWTFFRIAERLLPPTGLVAAIAIFAVNPLAVRLSTAVQPEPLMFLFYLAAAYFFLRWLDGFRRSDYILAAASTALAILVKLPAANIGLFFAALCLERFGWRAIARRDLWLFAALSLGPPAAWYCFAHGYWTEYGNSLGMSDEAYVRVAALEFLSALPTLLVRSIRTELHWIWTVPGAVVAVAAIPSLRAYEGRVVAYWLLALVALYVITIRTTGEDWAFYYHIASLPVACLAIGLGVANLLNRTLQGRSGLVPACVAIALLALVGLLQLWRTKQGMHPHWQRPIYECARRFESLVPRGALIIASGGADVDKWGNKTAYKAPYFFFWMDRKGFSLPDSEQSLESLEKLRQRGAGYFVAEPARLARTEGFDMDLRRTYRVLAECEPAILFDLGSPP